MPLSSLFVLVPLVIFPIVMIAISLFKYGPTLKSGWISIESISNSTSSSSTRSMSLSPTLDLNNCGHQVYIQTASTFWYKFIENHFIRNTLPYNIEFLWMLNTVCCCNHMMMSYYCSATKMEVNFICLDPDTSLPRMLTMITRGTTYKNCQAFYSRTNKSLSFLFYVNRHLLCNLGIYLQSEM